MPVFAMEFNYYTTRAAFNVDYTGTLRRYSKLVGPNQILFGSDQPFASAVLAGVTAVKIRSFGGFDSAGYAAIERDNATALCKRF
jgi:predicted TIM-barrel fold metal-dependent hydrolase